MALLKGRKQDTPDTDSETIPPDTPATDPAPFDPPADDLAPSKKTLSPLLLAAGLASLVVAIGVGAYFFFFASKVEEIEVPDTPLSQQAQAPETVPGEEPEFDDDPFAPAPESPVEKAPKPVSTQVVVQEQLPPRPPAIRDRIAAQSGKGLQPNNTVPTVTVYPEPSPELRAQLQTLWEQGAAAKWRGDYAAARRAWSEILRLRPGHPGIQEAIDKLP